MKKQPLTIETELLAFVDKLGSFYEASGIPRISGRIVGLLLVLEEPVSPEDISRILGVSRSSTSTNLAHLKFFKFAEEVRYPGDRKEYFKFSENALENMMKIKISQYDPFRVILNEGMEHLKKKSINQSKIKDMLKYVELEEKHFVTLLEEWKEYLKKLKIKERKS